MGTYSTFIHPKDGRLLQIHTLNDDCEEYEIGSLVKWHIWPNYPGEGKLLDGVHAVCFANEGDDCYVIIWHHRYVGILEGDNKQYADTLMKIIPSFEKSWWSKEAWVKKEITDLEFQLKRDQEKLNFLKTLIGKTDKEINKAMEERGAQELIAPIKETLNYSGICAQIFGCTSAVEIKK